MRKLIVLLLIGVVFVAGCIGNGQTSTQGTEQETPQESISPGGTQGSGEQTSSGAGETGKIIEKGDNWVLSWLEGSGQKLDFGFEDVTMGNLHGKRVTFPKELEGRTISTLPTDVTGDSVALLWDDSSVYDLRACDCADRYFEVDSYPIKDVEKASVIGQAIVGIRDDHPFVYWMLKSQILDINEKADDYAVIKDNDNNYVLVYVHGKKLTFVPISEWLPTEPGTPKDFRTESFGCDVNGIYPNVDSENDDYTGLLLATDCGLVVRSPDGQYYGIAFKDEKVEFLSNENDLDGFVLVYLPGEKAVYSAVVSLVENKYFVSEPIKVSERPDAGSLSTDGYLVLSWGKEMKIYEFVDNRAYREIGTFKLPFEAKDLFADLSLNVYILGEKEFLRLSGTVDDWVASGTESGETGGSPGTETGAETQEMGENGPITAFNSFELNTVSFGGLEGIAVRLKRDPDCRNVQDWLTDPNDGLSKAYFAFGKYLVEINGEGIRNIYADGEMPDKAEVSRIYVLPEAPMEVKVGLYSSDDVIMIGKDGKLYYVYSGEWKSTDTPEGRLGYFEGTHYLEWNLNAEGINAVYGDNYHILAWSGSNLYVITYSSDELYEGHNSGELEKARPEKITLPEKIEAVYDTGNGEGILIRTANGLYLYDLEGYYDYGPGRLYTLLENAPGEFAYSMDGESGAIYDTENGKFTWVHLSGTYDSSDNYVPSLEVYPSGTKLSDLRAFSIMYNTYDYQIPASFEGRIAIYNVTLSENSVSINADQSFDVPFTADYVYGEDYCYCHVNNHQNYFYAWSNGTYYVLLGPNHG